MISVDRRVFRAPHYLYEDAARRIVRGGDIGLLAEHWLVLCGVGGSYAGEEAERLGCSDVSGTCSSSYLCGGPRTGFTMLVIPGGGYHAEELMALASARSVKEVVVLGCCLGMRGDVVLGDVIVSAAALRDEEITAHYVPKEYPAAAHPLLVARLHEALSSAGLSPRVGLTATTLSPYSLDPEKAREMGEKRILCVDTHTSIFYVFASLLGMRAASILVVNGNLAEPISPGPVTEHLIESRFRAIVRVVAELMAERSRVGGW